MNTFREGGNVGFSTGGDATTFPFTPVAAPGGGGGGGGGALTHDPPLSLSFLEEGREIDVSREALLEVGRQVAIPWEAWWWPE